MYNSIAFLHVRSTKRLRFIAILYIRIQNRSPRFLLANQRWRNELLRVLRRTDNKTFDEKINKQEIRFVFAKDGERIVAIDCYIVCKE